MNRNAHLKISEGIDKAASPCHNEKKKDMIPCRGIIPTSKDLDFRPTMHLVIHKLEEKGVNHFSWGKGPFPPPKNSRVSSLKPIRLWPPITHERIWNLEVREALGPKGQMKSMKLLIQLTRRLVC